MKTTIATSILPLLIITQMACSSDGGSGASDAGRGGTWRIGAPFVIQPGEEFYQCTRVTITEDVWMHRVTPVAPEGVHHTGIVVDATPDEEGTARCAAGEPDWIALTATGVNSPSVEMPPGVAIRLSAGTQVFLQLHLYNTGDQVITGEGAADVVTLDPADVLEEAELAFMGPFPASDPAGPVVPPGPGQVLDFTCTLAGPTNLFAILPHMHQRGRHMKVTLVRGGAEEVLHDAPFDFTDQDILSFQPVAMAEGDQVKVSCTFDNDTGGSILMGMSTDEEMCLAIFYRYPTLPLDPLTGNFCVR